MVLGLFLPQQVRPISPKCHERIIAGRMFRHCRGAGRVLGPFVFERLADEFFDATTLVPVGNLNDGQASANRVTSRPGALNLG
jgi:hypothetical protein